jgi:hypothetical protein
MASRFMPLLFGEPTIKIDYLAEYNRITKPADYDPNDNAAPHYEQFFSQFASVAETLKIKLDVWPTQLSPTEFETLKEWANRNEPALEALNRAAQCPYWWVEARSRDGLLRAIELQHSNEHIECVWAVSFLARYKASQGDIDGAIRHLADLHMMGVHRASGNTSLLEQLRGLGICESSYRSVLAILDRCDVETSALNRLQNVFTPRLSEIEMPRFTQSEFLVELDSIQRAFTDDGHQDGRLIPKELCRIKENRVPYSKPLTYSAALRICLTHPGREETVEQCEDFWRAAKTLTGKPPWQLRERTTTYENELVPLLAHNYFLKDGSAVLARFIEFGWQRRTYGEAVVTVLAIRAFEAQKGHLPNSLRELMADGYLPNVPSDPYSGKPLVYRIVHDDFTLYSVGRDFTDSGGVGNRWGRDGGDQVFWPVRGAAQDL